MTSNYLKYIIIITPRIKRILDSSRVEQIYRSLRLKIRKDKKETLFIVNKAVKQRQIY